ncbi:MAG: ice-binding family protein [Acidimicrobiales bacterium]
MTSRVVFTAVALLVGGVGPAVVLGGGTRAGAAPVPVHLGAAAGFVVLAGSAVTGARSSAISGDVGVSHETGAIAMGFPQSTTVDGTVYPADATATATRAQADLAAAYSAAAGRAPCTDEPADLAGRTLVSGVYCGGTLGLSGTVTLDAQGNPGAVFIFQSAGTLVTGARSDVALAGGARACNVFWLVGGSATLGASSVFVGSVMSLDSVTADTGASVTGRLLARNGSVSLDTNTIAPPICTGTTTAPTTTTVPVPPPTPIRPAPTTTTTTSPPPVTTQTTTTAPLQTRSAPGQLQVPPRGGATAYGCGPALAYLAAYEAPGFSASCPAYSEGYQATTSCAGPDCSGGQRFITITVPCAAAYMNEASNSWVLSGLSNAPIDPYGYCH